MSTVPEQQNFNLPSSMVPPAPPTKHSPAVSLPGIKPFLDTTTLQDKHPRSIQVAFANQIPGAWETHPAPLSHRSTEKLRQEGISVVSAPSSCSTFIGSRLLRALSALVFNITKDGHPRTSETICPYSRVASLSLGKCFPYIQLEFPLLQFVFIISCPFRCTSENNLDPPSQKYH